MSGIIHAFVAAVNEAGRAFCEYAGGTFLQTAVLVAILLCADLLLRKRMRATLRYWIWMLVFVKLLLPPSLCIPTGIGYWLGGRTVPAALPEAVEDIRTPVSMAVGVPAESTPVQPSYPVSPVIESPRIAATDSTPLTWQGGLFLLWTVGVLAFAGLVIQRWRFVQALIAQGEPAPDELVDVLDQCRRRMGVRRSVGLRLSPNTFSPAVCGLLNPTILVPHALLGRLSPEGLRAVLIHELAHVRRGDLWINSLQTVLQAAYFYNPLVWLANAIVRRVREQAVDEMSLVALGAEARSYGNTLIDIAEMAFLRVSPALRLIGVAESRKSLEGRIRHMMTRPIPKSARVGLVGALAVAAVGAILLPMATAKTETTISQFTANLADGVTVEFVGVCNWAADKPVCWKADGSPCDMSMRAREWNRPREASDYGFMFKITGRSDADLTWAIDEAQGSSGSTDIVDAPGNRLEGYKAITASIPETPRQITVRVGLAAGPWRTTWTHDGKAGRAEGGDAGGMLWSQAFEDFDGLHVVASTRGGNDADRRVVAIDANDRMHAASATDASSVTNMWQLTTTFRNLKRAEIKEFQFQVRPYEWVRFENVSLIRGAKTEVEVWIKSVPQSNDEAPVQVTADGPPAKLPEDQRSLDQTLQMAEDLRRAREFEPARRAYQSIIQEWPNTEQAASARMGLVDLELASLIQSGDQTVAQQAVERVMTEFIANPYLPRTLDRVGDQYARIRQYETAESFYRKVIAMAADDERAADAQSAIAWIYFERGLYDEAMREYSKVVQDYPETSWAAGGQYWLAQCLFRKGELDRAREEFEKTVKTYPDDKYAGHARTQMALIERRRENDARRAAAWGISRASVGNPSTDAGAEPLQRTQIARPTLLHGTPWEVRISEILERLHTATEKAYRDVGLSGQDLETIYELQIPPQELMAKYRASWPAILNARTTATDELASLGADPVPFLLRMRDQSGERRGGDLFVDAIVKVGEKAVPAALDGLFDVDPVARIRAVASLGRLGDPRAVEPLLRVLANSDSRMRRDVVMSLGALGDRRAVDALLDLWSEQGRTDGGTLAWALAGSGDVRAVAPIMAALQEYLVQAKETGDWDKDGMLMSNYAGALGRLGDPRAVSLLEEALLGGPQRMKSGTPVFLLGEAAAHALRRLGYEVTGDREKGGYRVVKRSSIATPTVRHIWDAEAARLESANRLGNLSRAMLIYANEHGDKLPDSVENLQDELDPADKEWLLKNAAYLGKSLSVRDAPDRVVAYDKTLLAEGNGTNVLYLDTHVAFEKPRKLETLGITAADSAASQQDNEERAFRSYEVNRSVAEFPAGEDFSTPEAAYATINRMDRDDPSAWQRVSVARLGNRLNQEGSRRKSTVDPEWTKVLANARIREVLIWNMTKAVVIAELPQELSSKKIVDPFDRRSFELENGRWLNTGNDRFNSVEEAKAQFMGWMQRETAQADAMRDPLQHADEIKQAARRIFENIRDADYGEILSYHRNGRNGKWAQDGWKKFPTWGLYMVHTDYPSFALWCSTHFQDNPIVDIQLGDVFIGDTLVLDKTGWPTVPYKLTLRDGSTLAGNLPFRYSADKGQGHWHGMEGIDWHLWPSGTRQQ